jgi:hypothetical protein
MGHYVSERLIDLFEFNELYSLDFGVVHESAVNILITKNLKDWYSYDLDNKEWNLQITEDLRKIDARSKILDNGMSVDDITSMTWDDYKTLWEDENFDPNFLGVAYAFEDVSEYSFIGKIKTSANWKNVQKKFMNADVYIKIPDENYNYRIIPPYPSNGVDIDSLLTNEQSLGIENGTYFSGRVDGTTFITYSDSKANCEFLLQDNFTNKDLYSPDPEWKGTKDFDFIYSEIDYFKSSTSFSEFSNDIFEVKQFISEINSTETTEFSSYDNSFYVKQFISEINSTETTEFSSYDGLFKIEG